MKIVTIVGARPQFIKCAFVSQELRKVATEVLVHTGQHYDDAMSTIFFQELGIAKPDYNLDVGSGSHGAQTGIMLEKIEEVLLKETPDAVLVYGDTNTTLAGALAAVKLHIPLVHAEAGVRSFNRKMPEEINRVLTDQVSNLLFCPTQTAIDNLNREGVVEGIHLVGCMMLGSANYYGQIAEEKSTILDSLKLSPKNYALATIHRSENTDEPSRFKSILLALDQIATKEFPVVLPLHPRSQKCLKALALNFKHLQIIEPVSYLDMLKLEQNSKLILTDSGGVQKEAFCFQVPCVTVRDETEWMETVESGWNVISGTCGEDIVRNAQEMIQKAEGLKTTQGIEQIDVAKTIANILAQHSVQVLS